MTEDQSRKLDKLYSSLLEVPAGSPTDEKPLLEQIRVISRAYNRGVWSAKMIVWGVPLIASLGIAVQTVLSWGEK